MTVVRSSPLSFGSEDAPPVRPESVESAVTRLSHQGHCVQSYLLQYCQYLTAIFAFCSLLAESRHLKNEEVCNLKVLKSLIGVF